MEELTIVIECQPKDEEKLKLIEGLVSHNVTYTGDAASEGLTLVLRDAGGGVVGGLIGETYWGWLHVDLLWVQDSLRGRGYGKKLMATAEQAAVARGCRSAFLDTFSFQALPFYERLGYQVFGDLADFPPGHKRYFLRKSLKARCDEQSSNSPDQVSR